MRCQSCGKKDANVKYSENINGKKQTLYFCEECAKKLGFSDFSDFASLFSPIFTTIPEFNLLEKKKCNTCGYTIDEYLNSGMLGCEDCYSAFGNTVDELLYKINGKDKHIKLNPSKKDKSNVNNNNKNKVDEKIAKLKNKLEKLVKEERYEEAAIIRDEIKSLNKNSEG